MIVAGSCSRSSEDSSVPDGSISAQDGRLLVRLMVVHRVASDLFFVGHLDSFSGPHTGFCIIFRSIFILFFQSEWTLSLPVLCGHSVSVPIYQGGPLLSIRGQCTLSGLLFFCLRNL